MHYYKFNIPDWHLHTAHLSLVEDAVYRRLIDHYYDTESPIPTETHPVLRRLRLANESDIAAAILQEFFVLTDEGWRHKRCDRVIADYHNMAAANKENGKNGGRPRKGVLTDNPKETQSVISGNPSETLTTNQEPVTNKKPASLRASDLVSLGIPEQLANDFLTIRKTKRAPLTNTALDGIKREADAAGLTLSDAIKTCVERNWQAFKAEWVAGTGSSTQAAATPAAPSTYRQWRPQ